MLHLVSFFIIASCTSTLPLHHHEDTPVINVSVNSTTEALKDGTYLNYATSCLQSIIDETFANKTFNSIVYANVSSFPQYEIAQRIILQLHRVSLAHNWTWETTNGTRKRFRSFAVCIANCDSKNAKAKSYKYYNKKHRKTDHYLIILDDISKFLLILHNLAHTGSYSTNSHFLVYYDKLTRNHYDVSKQILFHMYKHDLHRSAVFIPTSLNSFVVYSTDIFGTAGQTKMKYCGRNPAFTPGLQCVNGQVRQLSNNNNRLFPRSTKADINIPVNCMLNAVLMINPPMVISQTEGIEIEILNVFKQKLQINYNYSVYNEAFNWGQKSEEKNPKCIKSKNCSLWSGPLKAIDLDPFNFGVGRVTMTPDRTRDFEFAPVYFMEDMLWVVPTANLIPTWANIITIFEWPTWLTLFGLVLLMGVLANIFSRLCKNAEHHYLQVLSACMLVSVQVLLSTAVATHPKSNPVRSLFITYAMFMIIVGSLYQSSLVNVLTHPRYEHQINSENEVFESGIGVGGLASRRHLFNNSKSARDMRIFDSYEIYADINDTEFQWLLTVAKDRDTITILGEYYVKYFVDTQHPQIVDEYGRSKVHLIKNDVLFTEQVSVVYSKNFILKSQFNLYIRIMFESGLIKSWRDHYRMVKTAAASAASDNDASGSPSEIDADDDDDDGKEGTKIKKVESGAVVITLAHLEGAFSFLIIGYLAGFTMLIFEWIYAQIRKCYVRRKLVKTFK